MWSAKITMKMKFMFRAYAVVRRLRLSKLASAGSARLNPVFLLLLVGALLAACTGETAAPPTPEPIRESSEPPLAADETVVLGQGANETHTFVVVTAESEARYIVNEEFFADALSKLGIQAGRIVVTGVTPGVSGELQLNFSQPDLLEAATFTVDMAGLRTDREPRDEWLQDYAIETNRFPEARFVATSANDLPASYTEGQEISFQLHGDLTIRDVTNPVTFEVTAVLSGDTIRGTAVRRMQMTDFGIDPPHFVNTLTVANDFRIEISLVARKR
jgi:polyisoprenoid-binding protein YceI